MWVYEGKEFTSDDIGDYKAFVYLITNVVTGRKYIGKKRFTKVRTKPPLKGKVRKRKVKSESDWQSYYGSNEELKQEVKELGESSFKREILRLCDSLTEASYYEAKEQFDREVLLTEEYYNSWIQVKVRSLPKKRKAT